MQTELHHLTDKELTTLVANKNDATSLEVELMQRIDLLLDLIEDLEAGIQERDDDLAEVE